MSKRYDLALVFMMVSIIIGFVSMVFMGWFLLLQPEPYKCINGVLYYQQPHSSVMYKPYGQDTPCLEVKQ